MSDPTKEMLRTIYIGAKSGCEAINGMLPKITSNQLRQDTVNQLEAYAGYANRAEQLMEEKGITGITFPLMNKLSVRGGVMMETMGSVTQDELARLLRVSSRESANRMRSAIADMSSAGCDREVLALGQDMMSFEIAEAEHLGTTKYE